MKKLFAILLFVLVNAPLMAQFQITSFSPADGATSVSTDTPIVVKFNHLLADIYQDDLKEAFILSPIASAEIDSIKFAEENGGSVVTIYVQHEPDTDYSVLFLNLIDNEGTPLEHIYISHYTTKPAYAGVTVSGTVEHYLLDIYLKDDEDISKNKKELLQSPYAGKQILKVFKKNPSGKWTLTEVNSDEFDYENGLVMLTTEPTDAFVGFVNDFTDDDDDNGDEYSDSQIKAFKKLLNKTTDDDEDGDDEDESDFLNFTTVITKMNQDKTFSFEHIPNGTYYALGFILGYEDRGSSELEFGPIAVGEYVDETQDYATLPIIVNDADISDINLKMINISALPASDLNTYMSDFSSILTSRFGAHTILSSDGDEILNTFDDVNNPAKTIASLLNPTGKSETWTIGFYVPDSNKVYLAVKFSFGNLFLNFGSPEQFNLSFEDLSEAIPLNYPLRINSNELADILLENGGYSLINSFDNNAWVTVKYVASSALIIDFYEVYDENYDMVTFTNLRKPVLIAKLSSSGWDSNNEEYFENFLFIVVDIATGNVLYKTGDNPEVDVANEKDLIINRFALNQNYPNPFNPSTTINFSLPQASNAKITVYNALGQAVKVITNQAYSAGSHSIKFDATHLSSGIYFYRIEAGAFTTTRSMTLIK